MHRKKKYKRSFRKKLRKTLRQKQKNFKITLQTGKFPDRENIPSPQYNGRKWTHMKAHHCDITEKR